MKVSVLTACYGDYDEVIGVSAQAVRDEVTDLEWVAVSDQPGEWVTWVEPHPHIHPRMAAKYPKCLPDVYCSGDISIWVDASIAITAPDFVEWCVDQLGDSPIAQFPHPDRTSILQEAEESRAPKYDQERVRQQAQAYVDEGFPDGWGLWATGIIVRRRGLAHFGNRWLDEQQRWTYQDQISEPPVLWECGLKPVPLEGGLWDNERFVIREHRRED